ncbi:MAG: hypothetical protein JO076_12340 [Verrucomicrobia bacterium]|nr:hypothetical protein [Verrucomicrobiota bacterium]
MGYQHAVSYARNNRRRPFLFTGGQLWYRLRPSQCRSAVGGTLGVALMGTLFGGLHVHGSLLSYMLAVMCCPVMAGVTLLAL